MSDLKVFEIKAFIPAKEFELSKSFYQDVGFKLASSGELVAYLHYGGASFTQSWRMRDFGLTDPSGVCWRIAQNIGQHS